VLWARGADKLLEVAQLCTRFECGEIMIVMCRDLCGVKRGCEGDLGSFPPDGWLESGLCEWLCVCGLEGT
jgi:hypothetical protein